MFESAPFVEDTRGLLARLARGDGEAANRLFAIHSERLRRAVRLRMPAELRPWLEAEDVCQTALVKALRGLDSFEYRGEGTFLSWLVRIADHAIRDAARAAARRASVRPGGRSEDLVADPHAESPSRAVVQQEEFALLERGIDALPAGDRELLIDREILGADLADLAARTGKSPVALRVALHRAKARLARWFEQHA
jgi:RNA polymerase sigma-70 factor (ECF subfamily)